MRTSYDIVLRPIITEQSMEDMDIKKYVFEVAKKATKIDVARAVEELFKVKVVKVNTLNVKPKMKRVRYITGLTRRWKKAIVTLKEGKIELL